MFPASLPVVPPVAGIEVISTIKLLTVSDFNMLSLNPVIAFTLKFAAWPNEYFVLVGVFDTPLL